jgi:hypothetical protein
MYIQTYYICKCLFICIFIYYYMGENFHPGLKSSFVYCAFVSDYNQIRSCQYSKEDLKSSEKFSKHDLASYIVLAIHKISFLSSTVFTIHNINLRMLTAIIDVYSLHRSHLMPCIHRCFEKITVFWS